MNFGCSVGDFVTTGLLAWNVYKSCKDAPESFQNISNEILSLHAVLKEAEEVFTDHALSESEQANLKVVGDGCKSVLCELQGLVDRYERVGTQGRRTWDRMKWATKDVGELRMRLVSNTTMLAAFMSTSQVVVEKKLNKFLREFRDGKREHSVISTQTVESISTREQELWRSIRKELQDIGITVTAFEKNRSFIMGWMRKTIATGGFEEHEDDSTIGYSTTDGELEEEDLDGEDLDEEEWGREGIESEDIGAGQVLLGPRFPPAVSRNIAPQPALRNTVTRLVFRNGPSHQVTFPITAPERAASKTTISQEALLGSAPSEQVGLKHSTRAKMGDARNRWGVELDEEVADIEGAPSGGVTGGGEIGRKRHNDRTFIKKEPKARKASDKVPKTGTRWPGLFSRGDDPFARPGTILGSQPSATPPAKGSKHGNVARMPKWLGIDANVKARDTNLVQALRGAARRGDASMVGLLLKKRANIKPRDLDLGKVLRGAARRGYVSVVRLLLEEGVNVNEKDQLRRNPLFFASCRGQEETVRLLLQHGADIKAGDMNLGKALRAAARRGHVSVVQLLLQEGANIDAANSDKQTALHMASAEGRLPVVEVLLASGADPKARNVWGKRAQDLKKGHSVVSRSSPKI